MSAVPSCESLGSNEYACVSASFACIFNMSTSQCSTVEHCPLPVDLNILLNAAAQAICSAETSLDASSTADSSNEDSSDSSDCSASYILPIVYLSLFSVCCFCAAPFRYRSIWLRRVLLFCTVPSWLAFVALSFLYRSSLLSCNAFVGIMFILIFLLLPGGFGAVAVLCGAEQKVQKMKINWKKKQGEIKERKRKEAEKKVMLHLFSTNPFAEKYVLRLVLQYDGRFTEEELDPFAHIRRNSSEEIAEIDGSASQQSAQTDGVETARLSVVVDPMTALIPMPSEGLDSAAIAVVSVPLSASEVQLEEIHTVRFHFPTSAQTENTVH